MEEGTTRALSVLRHAASGIFWFVGIIVNEVTVMWSFCGVVACCRPCPLSTVVAKRQQQRQVSPRTSPQDWAGSLVPADARLQSQQVKQILFTLLRWRSHLHEMRMAAHPPPPRTHLAEEGGSVYYSIDTPTHLA